MCARPADGTSREAGPSLDAGSPVTDGERRFRDAAEAAPVPLWTAAADGRRTFASRAWLELTGRSLPEELGDGWLEGVDPEDRNGCEGAYREALAARRGVRLEYRVRRADGDRRTLVDTALPRFDPAGTFAGYVGTGVDVTALRDAEASYELLAAAARLFASGLDMERTLGGLAALLVPRVADYATIHVVTADERLHQVAAAHVDPAKRALLEELGRMHRPVVRGPGAMARALSTLASRHCRRVPVERVRQVPRDPALRRVQEALAPRSYCVVPIAANGRAGGLISVVMAESGRTCRESDLRTLERLAVPAALAIENARLREAERNARRLEAQLAGARLQALRAQLRPHLLFNALNTVAMLVRRGARNKALDAVVALSELLRWALAHDAAPEVSLAEELAMVELYLEIERLRFRDQLGVVIEVPDAFRAARVPNLILQPVVENAVQHGMARRSAAVHVRIVASRVDDRLRVDVMDDGPGLPPGWTLDEAPGLGLRNVRARLQELFGERHRFEVRDAPGGGALVRLELPWRASPAPPAVAP